MGLTLFRGRTVFSAYVLPLPSLPTPSWHLGPGDANRIRGGGRGPGVRTVGVGICVLCSGPWLVSFTWTSCHGGLSCPWVSGWCHATVHVDLNRPGSRGSSPPRPPQPDLRSPPVQQGSSPSLPRAPKTLTTWGLSDVQVHTLLCPPGPALSHAGGCVGDTDPCPWLSVSP